MQTKAVAKYVRVSPRKARIVVDKIRGKEVRQAGNGVEVLVPDERCAENALSDFPHIPRLPEVGEKGLYLLVVIDYDFILSPLSALIIGADTGEAEDDALREFALALEIGLQSGEVTGLEFREGVEHDARDEMLHKGVDKALQHVAGELDELLFRQVEGREEFLVHHLTHITPDLRILAAFLYGIQPAEVADRRKDGVGTVEEGHLAFMVRGLAGDEEDIEPGLVGGEFGGNLLRGFDDPEMEDFGLVEEVVLIAGPFAKGGGVVTGISRDDTVDKGAVNAATLLEP